VSKRAREQGNTHTHTHTHTPYVCKQTYSTRAHQPIKPVQIQCKSNTSLRKHICLTSKTDPRLTQSRPKAVKTMSASKATTAHERTNQ
jgi:hypothetical protein